MHQFSKAQGLGERLERAWDRPRRLVQHVQVQTQCHARHTGTDGERGREGGEKECRERSLRRSGVGSDVTAGAVSEVGSSGAWMPKEATVEKMQKRAKLLKPRSSWPTPLSVGGWSKPPTRYISSM